MDKKDGKIIKTLNTVATNFFRRDENEYIIIYNENDGLFFLFCILIFFWYGFVLVFVWNAILINKI